MKQPIWQQKSQGGAVVAGGLVGVGPVGPVGAEEVVGGLVGAEEVVGGLVGAEEVVGGLVAHGGHTQFPPHP